MLLDAIARRYYKSPYYYFTRFEELQYDSIVGILGFEKEKEELEQMKKESKRNR